jgi:hypothetical protein
MDSFDRSMLPGPTHRGVGRWRDILAARRAHEISPGLEHVVHERTDIPFVTQRLRIEFARSAGNLASGPLTGPSMEVQEIVFHGAPPFLVAPSALPVP